MTPIVDGKIHHFEFRGLYDGVTILADTETRSIWHHITGESLHGPLAGNRLPTYNMLQMTVAEAFESFPDIRIAVSDRPIADERHRFAPWAEKIPLLGKFFFDTMSPEDERRPTMDIGVGVWTDNVQRFYPMKTLAAHDNVIIDVLDDTPIVVFYAVGARAPTAIRLDARDASWDGRILRFANGSWIQQGVLYDENGDRREMERPMQLFTRWYGYALTFPDTEVYGVEQ